MKPEVANKIEGINSPNKSVEATDALTESDQGDDSGGVLSQFRVLVDRIGDQHRRDHRKNGDSSLSSARSCVIGLATLAKLEVNVRLCKNERTEAIKFFDSWRHIRCNLSCVHYLRTAVKYETIHFNNNLIML